MVYSIQVKTTSKFKQLKRKMTIEKFFVIVVLNRWVYEVLFKSNTCIHRHTHDLRVRVQNSCDQNAHIYLV